MSSPPAKKRKRDDSVSSTSGRTGQASASWVVPAFQASDLERTPITKKPASKTSAFKAPSFHAAKLTPISSSRPFKALVDPYWLLKSSGDAFSNSFASSSTATAALGSSRFISSLSDQFKRPEVKATPAKELKPLIAPPPPSSFRPDTGTPGPSTPRTKPLNSTPLTTRLAFITTPQSSTAKSQPSSDDSIEAQTRTIVANQARENLIKQESDDASPFWLGAGAPAMNMEEGIGESLRGMAISPEKPDRAGKRRGFVRNGLAERASHLISRAQHDFSLWSHDVGRTLVHSAPSAKTPPYDLRVSVVSILTAAFKETVDALEEAGLDFPPLPPPYALAKCKISRAGKDETAWKDGQDVLVLFAYSTVTANSTAAAAARLSTMIGLDQGKELLLWRPWIEVNLPARRHSGETREEVLGTETAKGRSGTPALLCSRYLVLPAPRR